MMTERVVIVALLLGSFACQKKPLPTPKEYELLASHHDLYGPLVGIEHKDGSEEALAFRSLLRNSRPVDLFRALLREKYPGAQLYGMCGLYFVDRAEYERNVGRYGESAELISFTNADATDVSIPVGTLLKKRDFPAFCRGLAGRRQ